MPEKSKHFLLIYCSSLRCCLSSSTSLVLAVLKAYCKIFEVFCATETWLVNSLFFFASESILDVISNKIFDMSLFGCNKFCWMIILSCNAKKDVIKFSFLIFSNCPLVRICDAMINWKLPTLKTYVCTACWSGNHNLKHWHLLHIKPNLAEIFQNPPILAFRRNKNLRDIIDTKLID